MKSILPVDSRDMCSKDPSYTPMLKFVNIYHLAKCFFFVVFLPLEIFTYWLEHALLLGIPIYLICVGKISVPQNTFQDTLGNVFFSNCNLLIILVVDNLTTYIFRLGFYGLWFMGTVPLFNPVTFSHIFASKSQFNFVPLHY